MNSMAKASSKQRFLETMCYGKPDRVPYFEEGIRQEVLDQWYRQGLDTGADLEAMFHTDRREEIDPDLGPRPRPRRFPVSRTGLKEYVTRLDPHDPGRLPEDWQAKVESWRDCEHVVMLRVHDGFFLSMGVGDWARFYDVIHLVKDDPDFVSEMMMLQGEFNARFVNQVLAEVDVDAVIFSEPIGGMNGPIIAPWTYEQLVLPSYAPVMDVVRRHGVQVIILRTYANARVLIPAQLKAGFNCLWACECETGAMDYHEIRQAFGSDLRLVGGIDLDALRFGKKSIYREVMGKVPRLLESGGYVPLADGRVRPDVPLEDYLYYRRLLEEITQ
jgi:hypothetical protein